MTVFDMLALGMLALSGAVSFMRGMIAELMSLASWLAAFLFAKTFAAPFAETALGSVQPQALAVTGGFVLLFAAALIVLKLLRSLLTSAAESAGLGGINRLLGGIFGLIKGLLLVTLAVLVCAFTDLPQSDDWKNSLTAPYFEQLAATAVPYLPDYLANQVQYPKL